MFTRRTLFARLTAVALAPLAKWLPKEEPKHYASVIRLSANDPRLWVRYDPNHPAAVQLRKHLANSDVVVECWPVPQEKL